MFLYRCPKTNTLLTTLTVKEKSKKKSIVVKRKGKAKALAKSAYKRVRFDRRKSM